MLQTVLVFLGGGAGAALRHGVGIGSKALLGTSFPFGTFIVNVAGSFLMGLLVALVLPRVAGQTWQLFLATGLLGGFTTFSSFSLDAAFLWERGQVWLAAAYVGGSVLFGLLAIFAGLALGRVAA